MASSVSLAAAKAYASVAAVFSRYTEHLSSLGSNPTLTAIIATIANSTTICVGLWLWFKYYRPRAGTTDRAGGSPTTASTATDVVSVTSRTTFGSEGVTTTTTTSLTCGDDTSESSTTTWTQPGGLLANDSACLGLLQAVQGRVGDFSRAMMFTDMILRSCTDLQIAALMTDPEALARALYYAERHVERQQRSQ
ncbi:hypothetical protein GGS23DRAFT_600915 [Durotheca rogersii]|uniref:uncharacterized protein n=1 Tax=Durotheca rogersii TaxID=419775 RepID=UPI00221F6BA8|nr:uncharacterized protein GGS23DRAFT_600915 [Durotheca rogersii]KAI5857298.1 hypothetical protein GGS23DRAFT_600915 [Durotheca rogersii]